MLERGVLGVDRAIQVWRTSDGPVQFAGRVLRRAQRDIRSLRPLTDHDAPMLVGTHHKTGTVLTMKVLRRLTREFGGNLVRAPFDGFVSDRSTIHHDMHLHHSRPEEPRLRGVHVVRDPRAVVASGYHYHLTTTETWALRPQDRFDGRSYQEELRRLPETEGVHLEIETARGLEQLAQWDYDDPRFLDIGLEELIGVPSSGWNRVATHLGFTAAARRVLHGAVAEASLPSDVSGHPHATGAGRRWDELLTERHLDHLLERHPGLHDVPMYELG